MTGDNGDAEKILAESRAIWDANAEAWDARMSQGRGWQATLMAPTVERMLRVEPGERVLDIACGNGLFSRRLAAPGAFNWANYDMPPLMFVRLRSRGG